MSFPEALSLVAESPAAGAGSDAQAAPGTAANALNAVTLLRCYAATQKRRSNDLHLNSSLNALRYRRITDGPSII